jgi:hypothetical protein
MPAGANPTEPPFVTAMLVTRAVNRVLRAGYKIEDLFGDQGWVREEFIMFDITARVLRDQGLLD